MEQECRVLALRVVIGVFTGVDLKPGTAAHGVPGMSYFLRKRGFTTATRSDLDTRQLSIGSRLSSTAAASWVLCACVPCAEPLLEVERPSFAVTLSQSQLQFLWVAVSFARADRFYSAQPGLRSETNTSPARDVRLNFVGSELLHGNLGTDDLMMRSAAPTPQSGTLELLFFFKITTFLLFLLILFELMRGMP